LGLKRVLLRVEGRGCGSCIAPIKTYLFKHPAVKSVHVVGYNIIIAFDDNYTVEDILRETSVLEYYRVLEIKELAAESENLEESRNEPRYAIKAK